ncbi:MULTISPECIES: class I SAM-dependent methyltransferase [unclassified Undibacterium]|uniref:class I SAM-dependent methyltransferase n=1 Tax=unclassified Undibacterium TaxID=2630295 RepID=UPI002AC91A0F|nr:MULTISPECIES: class I SAM-dependent methyltransferase [unclassified Undibacterium]MEB0137735.1 class I SAM-dependent methyltransferase [Undibacterium sp. CCC2.1]MEB0172823.1 class I SAM-dependent methyltransferase [Undibacterium sp. CCC1.1]MEB0176703.1 class I SAM-dependent methyltransferase [Undibacterium sp. CCC3.4]MEB0215971.1 class I SAM-dependent methyltransferase [Undibacterium sp. 5I2]WPX42310.1 class I SAM-dependent methyltransferase [Undibacterium sp. CCC3.4]
MDGLESPIIDLDAWLALSAGQYVLAQERVLFDAMTADIFGYHALQIGMPQIDALAASRMPRRWLSNTALCAEPGKSARPIVVSHDFTELPFDAHSMDLVVLPHVLEFASEPHQILREVERILIPEGRLIISGFNQASMWGARQLAARLGAPAYLPREGEFISAKRLKDWLKLLNMEVGRIDFRCYAPPCRSDKWLQRYHFMEAAGQKWWPYFGAVYMMQAVKRVRGMHLIGPAVKRRRPVRGNAVAVVNKSGPD